MDIKAKVDELMTKVKGDDAFLAKFKEDPEIKSAIWETRSEDYSRKTET